MLFLPWNEKTAPEAGTRRPIMHAMSMRTWWYTYVVVCLVGGLVLGVAPSGGSPAWAAGEDCFATAFRERIDGDDPVNAYLLMLACYYAYGNNLNVADFASFQAKFREVFTRWGLREFDFIDIRARTADTQAVVMSNEKLVVVVFRGSESRTGGAFDPVKTLYDWVLTDFNFFKLAVPLWGDGIKVHRGFYTAVDVAYPRLKTLVRDHLAGGDKRLWVTGHSLGAGLAPLAAFRLAFDGIPVQGVAHYAGPRVGNEAFVTACRARLPFLQRWVNDHDLVTMVPFTWMNFRHAGAANNLYPDGRVILGDQEFRGAGKAASHAPGLYLQRLYERLTAADRLLVPAPPAFRLTVGAADPALERRFLLQDRFGSWGRRVLTGD